MAYEKRLHMLLDKQNGGQPLTDAERHEAEGLVELADHETRSLSTPAIAATRFEHWRPRARSVAPAAISTVGIRQP